MTVYEMSDCLERSPVIAAIHENQWKAALNSPAEVLFYLKANLMTVQDHIKQAQTAGKRLFVHLDLADGIGKDRTGIDFLAKSGVDGIISTRGQLIKQAKDVGLLTVQRFFALDSQGVNATSGMIEISTPDLIEIMPGIVGKVIEKFSKGSVPVIAGGLVSTKSEVTDALGYGATAVSTGEKDLWYL